MFVSRCGCQNAHARTFTVVIRTFVSGSHRFLQPLLVLRVLLRQLDCGNCLASDERKPEMTCKELDRYIARFVYTGDSVEFCFYSAIPGA